MRRSAVPDDGPTPFEGIHPDPWQATPVQLRGALTVMLGRSQLLQRQIRNGQVWDAAACLETLMLMDEAVRDMESQLREIETERA
jgi:hypothetical protein